MICDGYYNPVDENMSLESTDVTVTAIKQNIKRGKNENIYKIRKENKKKNEWVWEKK